MHRLNRRLKLRAPLMPSARYLIVASRGIVYRVPAVASSSSVLTPSAHAARRLASTTTPPPAADRPQGNAATHTALLELAAAVADTLRNRDGGLALRDAVRYIPDDVLDVLDCGLADAVAQANHALVRDAFRATARTPLPLLLLLQADAAGQRTVRLASQSEVVETLARCAGWRGIDGFLETFTVTRVLMAGASFTENDAQPQPAGRGGTRGWGAAAAPAKGAVPSRTLGLGLSNEPAPLFEAGARRRPLSDCAPPTATPLRSQLPIHDDDAPASEEAIVGDVAAAAVEDPEFMTLVPPPPPPGASATGPCAPGPRPPAAGTRLPVPSDAALSALHAVPTFAVPLTVAADWAQRNFLGRSLDADVSESAAITELRDAVLALPGHALLTGPWRAPPPTAEALCSGVVREEYVMQLPPGLHAKRADEELAEHRVADHDHYRLARYLHTAFRVTVDSLERGPVAEVLTRPVLQVILSSPMFEYRPPGSPDDEAFPVVSRTELVERTRGVLPDLTPVTPPMPDGRDDCSASPCRSRGDVRFVLPEESRPAPPRDDLRRLCDADLQALLQVCKHPKEFKANPRLRYELQERYALTKAPPPVAGLQTFRDKLRREVLRRQLPHASPFLDKSVFAFFVYDLLPPDHGVLVDALRTQFLPADGTTCVRFREPFLKGFPHLFVHRLGTRGIDDWILERADSPNLQPEADPQQLTEDDINSSIFAVAPAELDLTRPTSTSMVMSKLPHLVRKRLKQEGGLATWMRRYPEHFNVVSEELFMWVSGAGRLGLDEVASGGGGSDDDAVPVPPPPM